MEKRSLALQNVSEALRLDGKGFHQAAFSKYLQSLHTLTSYLSDMYNSFGFEKMLEKKKEIKHVLSVVNECSDRVSSIIDNDGQARQNSVQMCDKKISTQKQEISSSLADLKFPAFEKMRNENMLLLRTYQMRIERAPDKYTKSNLKLELQRRIAENFALAKSKYALAVKEHQKESVNNMQETMRKLFENGGRNLSKKESEKKELYARVLTYTAIETWSSSLKCSSFDLQASEVVQNVLQRTVSCDGHPLSKWLIKKQTEIKFDVDSISKQYLTYITYLPDQDLHLDSSISSFRITYNEMYVQLISNEVTVSIPLDKLSSLQKKLEFIYIEINNTIESALEVFYLTYKSLLPEDSERICYKLMESYFLHPLWSNIITLCRLKNLPNEYKVLETMLETKSSLPSQFGFGLNNDFTLTETCKNVITKLKNLPFLTLGEKLESIVQVSQQLCEGDHFKSADSDKRLIGADDFIPLLSYVIVQSGTYQLVSECYALEQLFNQKYMLGEECYALSSFLTALKYLEMKKLIDGENSLQIGDEGSK